MTMVDTPSTAAPTLKAIGNSCSQNTSNTSSRKECEKDGAKNSVHDEGADAIESHHKSMFLVQPYFGQEEGRTTIVASPALKTIGAYCSQNNSNTPSRKGFKKDGSDKPVDNEGY